MKGIVQRMPSAHISLVYLLMDSLPQSHSLSGIIHFSSQETVDSYTSDTGVAQSSVDEQVLPPI